ncbi:MAG TPA: SDR family oxidoreductase [Abditibacteriaceae bacterium]|jgi:3-oxoacyl-[acyl-carrier protein] reductase
MKLQNKTALVTGASRGIGRAIALRLAREGARVAVHYKGREDKANEVVDEIKANGGEAFAVAADIADSLDVRRLAGEIEARWKTLDILVNNAGWATFGRLDEVSEDDFDGIFDLNVRGLFFLSQQCAKVMNDGGRIVNISSGITRINSETGSVYAASKAAVEAFTRCWAADLGPRGITVNTVSPGMTETDLLLEVTPKENLESMAAQTPLGRLGQPQDIADVVAFLCSDDARWLTAQNILANGGVG